MNFPALLILVVVFLGVVSRPYLKTFRQQAVWLALVGVVNGLILGAYYASNLANSSFENQAKVIAFSIAVNATVVALMILPMWIVHRRRTS